MPLTMLPSDAVCSTQVFIEGDPSVTTQPSRSPLAGSIPSVGGSLVMDCMVFAFRKWIARSFVGCGKHVMAMCDGEGPDRDLTPSENQALSKSAAEWRSGICSSTGPQLRLTIRPRITAGRASIRSAQATTWL